MQLQFKLIRDILLKVESDANWPRAVDLSELSGYGEMAIRYHINFLDDVGLISIHKYSTNPMTVDRLTVTGHEFVTWLKIMEEHHRDVLDRLLDAQDVLSFCALRGVATTHLRLVLGCVTQGKTDYTSALQI